VGSCRSAIGPYRICPPGSFFVFFLFCPSTQSHLDHHLLTDREASRGPKAPAQARRRSVVIGPACVASAFRSRPARGGSITSPFEPAQGAVFTVNGCRTTLVKLGSVYFGRARTRALDVERLRRLLLANFGLTLRCGDSSHPPLAVYAEDAYRGAAMICATSRWPYLTNRGRTRAHGEGVGRDLWEAMSRAISPFCNGAAARKHPSRHCTRRVRRQVCGSPMTVYCAASSHRVSPR